MKKRLKKSEIFESLEKAYNITNLCKTITNQVDQKQKKLAKIRFVLKISAKNKITLYKYF